MSEQLVLELARPEPPTFANFLPGANAEAVQALRELAEGRSTETAIVVWGAPGAGKTHLLRAAVNACVECGRTGVFLAHPGDIAAHHAADLAGAALVAIDLLDTANAEQQADLFTLYNTARAENRHLLFAAHVPPARLPMRDDLRTRMQWGLTYEITALSDLDKPAALVAYAHGRGFALSAEVVRYLLLHARRDMATLIATLGALDRYSLATRRPITVSMLREWLRSTAPDA